MKILLSFILLTSYIFITNAQSFWQQTNGTSSSGIVYTLASNSSGHVFAGVHGDGVFRTTNNGDSWEQFNSGNTISALAVNASGLILAGTGGGGILISTDNGINWNPTSLTLGAVYGFAFNSSGHVFAAGWTTVYRSTDNGQNWVEINSGIKSGTMSINCIVVNTNGEIFLGTGSGVYKSTNNGDSWSLSSSLEYNVNDIAKNSSGYLFIGTQSQGVYRSTDGGNNWEQINNGLTFPFVNALAVNSAGEIFAGTSNGIFKSSDNGTTWVEISSGLSNKMIYSLTFSSNGYAYAGNFMGKVSRSVDPTTNIEEIYTSQINYNLYQNYPNPFNPSTVISYQLSAFSNVVLKVYDLLGNEVATLVNEYKNAGRHEVVFDGSGLSSGIYFYRLTTPEFTKTSKMILNK